MKILLKAIFLTVALILILGTCSPFLGMNSPLTGKPAPDFTLDTLDSGQVTFSAFRRGRPAILFFWATWCPHCRRELQTLTSQKSQIAQKGIGMLTIDLKENVQQVREFVQTHGLDLTIALDSDGRVAEDYMIIGVPTFFLIDGNGVVAKVSHEMPEDYLTVLLGRQP